MLKNHPKGLFVLFFTNMGERFGYYTMLAVFVLYLQAKFGLDETKAGYFYGAFLFGVYFLPLLGGYIADNILGYGRTIATGLVIMLIGYACLAVPGSGLPLIIFSLVIISLGTGLFKGNLQALVGNIYDNKQYGQFRDSAFILFYMGINIGAFFAPFAASWATNLILGNEGLFYNQRIPNLANQYLAGNLINIEEYTVLAKAQMGDAFTNLTDFSSLYINTLSKSYNLGFALASASMVLSILIFTIFRKYYKASDVSEKQKSKKAEQVHQVVRLSKEQERTRYIALFLVFGIVIFFWMAFHQNGFTMTLFAKNYTVGKVDKITFIWFHLPSMLAAIAIIIGLILLIGKSLSRNLKILGGSIFIAGVLMLYRFVSEFSDSMPITPQQFQSFNPIFIVFLSPLIMVIFKYLGSKQKEPSAPKKIGFGMILTAFGFLILCIASLGLKSPADLKDGASQLLVSPYWLISSYFTLTIAELFLSPIGISFVSKVAPPQHKGLMQGGWFAATAMGNLLAGLIGPFYKNWQPTMFFGLLVCLSLVSAIIMFSLLKIINKASEEG